MTNNLFPTNGSNKRESIYNEIYWMAGIKDILNVRQQRPKNPVVSLYACLFVCMLIKAHIPQENVPCTLKEKQSFKVWARVSVLISDLVTPERQNEPSRSLCMYKIVSSIGNKKIS